jgi:hypothetical protein
LIALLLWKRKYGILLGLTGLFNEILVKMKEDVLGKMMERMLDFLLGNTCSNAAGNCCKYYNL